MSFASEDKLLFLCSRVCLSEAAKAAAAELVRRDLDWEYVLVASIQHGVSPLFCHGLAQLACDETEHVPARVLRELTKLYEANRARNRRMYRTIGDIFAKFGAGGVQAIALKDIPLARQVYPDIGMRPIGDIDVLIHWQDYDRVATCMAELGFFPEPTHDLQFTLKYACAHHFRRPSDNVWVDVQWNIMEKEWDKYGEGNFAFDVEQMWHGARNMRVDGYELLVPKTEDMLYHLCLHLEGHRYRELILFCDIAEFFRHFGPQLDWDYLLKLTRAYRSEASLYYVLFLLQRAFDVSLPESALRELKPNYHPARIHSPMFDHLTKLHLWLDEIRTAACPPHELVLHFETTVRREAFLAMQAYRHISNLASAFTDNGSVLILEGKPSRKILPDERVASFDGLRLLILKNDVPRMQQVLAGEGFASNPDSGQYAKRWQAHSADPALGGHPIPITFTAQFEDQLGLLPRDLGSGAWSRKNIVLTSIRRKLHQRPHACEEAGANISIVAFTPEELVLYLSARLGHQQRDRLFELCALLDLLNNYSGRIDWERLLNMAREHGTAGLVAQGLMMVAGFVPLELPSHIADMLKGHAAPRLLQSARYDPAAWGRYAALKRPFFYLYSLLSLERPQDKWRYLQTSLVGSKKRRAVLPALVVEFAKAMFFLVRKPAPTTTDFAFWIETQPESLPKEQAG
jgi:hypothetical protein